MIFKRITSSIVLIEILIILPFLAIINIILINRFNTSKIEKTSIFWSLVIFIYFLFLVLVYNEFINFQFTYLFNWFNKNNFSINWGVIKFSMDGISFFFIGLSMILIPICLLMSLKSITNLKKEFQISLFLILILLIGVFTILDILGFYILFEGILIPMFLIIGVWGSREEKIKAAYYFFFYTLIGSLLMLLGIFKIYSITGTTSYQNIILIELPNYLQFWIFLGFFSSLAVKIPMIPFHIWLPQAHVEAPVAGSVLLAGILLKLGGYGFIRFAYPILPIASEYFTPFILVISILAIIYASIATCRQTDIKRLIAYSSVAHMGLVTLSIFVHSIEGLIAAIVMMIAHGLVSSGLFMTSAVLYIRHHSRAIRYYRGLITTMPIFSTITLLLILANIGFPLTLNFIVEMLSILAALKYSYILGLLACIGSLLSTIYALFYYNRIYFGELSPHLKHSREMLIYEFQSFLPLIFFTILLGIIPNIIIKFILTSSYINISL